MSIVYSMVLNNVLMRTQYIDAAVGVQRAFSQLPSEMRRTTNEGAFDIDE